MNHAKLLSEAFKALDEHLQEENKFQSAVNQFMSVCPDCDDLDFTKYSPYILRTAAKYIVYGFERDMALRYAKEYGIDGLYLIDDLQSDFKFKLFK